MPISKIATSLFSMALPAWVKPVGIILVIVSWSGFCFVKGMSHVQNNWDAQEKTRKLTERVEFMRVEKVVEHVKYTIVPQIQIVEKQGRDIIKKVPVYVPQEAADRCVINNGFVWLHEAARSGLQIPYDSGRVTDAAPGIGLADVGRTITVNYTKFRTMKLQCQGLLEIVKSLPQEKQ